MAVTFGIILGKLHAKSDEMNRWKPSQSSVIYFINDILDIDVSEVFPKGLDENIECAYTSYVYNG